MISRNEGVVRVPSLIGMGFVTLFASAAIAPTKAQPPAVSPPTRDELDPVPAQQAQRKTKLTVEGEIERSPCALDDPGYDQIKIKINSATFNKLGPVAPSELTASYAEYVATEQPISVLCRIRDAAATKLRAMGYVAAVQVPVQKIEDGAVKFEVLFAKVTSIRVVGAAGRNGRLIESYLSKLNNGSYFNRFEAERYLLLARDIPGHDVRLSLKPAGFGAGNMIAEITLSRTPVIVDFSSQNFAGKSTGRIGGQLRASFNGLTGMGDRTVASFFSTPDFKEQKIVQLGHDMLIGSEGLRLGGRMTYAWTKPDLGAAIGDVRAKTLFLNAELSYPMVRKLAYSIRLAGGLDVINQKVDFAGSPLSEDRLRVGYVRLDAEAIDLKGVGPGGAIGWRFNATIEGRKGLNILGASANCATAITVCAAAGFVPPSLIDANPTAHLFRFSASVELRPLRKLAVMISPRGQIGSHGQFAFEQFSTGNYGIGRGFDPGALVGDRGAGFQTELRLDAFRLNPKSKIDFQPYLFADNAWVWDRTSFGPGAQRLSSVGGGVRIGIANHARLDLSAALPRTALPGEAKRRDPRFLISFSTILLPWSNR